MKRILISLAFALATLASGIAPANAHPGHKHLKRIVIRPTRVVVRTTRVIVTPAPVLKKRVIVPKRHWVPAHWDWRGIHRGYVWVPGHWR